MKKVILIIIGVLVVLVLGSISSYYILIGSPSKKEDSVIFKVEEGENYSSIANNLKDKGLIKSVLAYKIYLKINKPDGLEYGSYYLKTSDNVKKLIETLKKGSVNLNETKTVTFIEGKNMRYLIDKVNKEFGISEEDVLKTLSDKEYLDELINKYWFLTDEIKNSKIYYSLEGYLYPDTYEFYTNASIKDIFKTMLDNMESKLNNYRSEIEKSDYSIHEMITLASIIELEAGSADDRRGVAGVFYNRLKSGWSLGSDVTTYYAEKLDLWSRDLKKSELNECNSYNTRSSCMNGKLPVGPICNASINSLVAAIEPKKHNYYYFVADKNGKTYFNETDSGHTSTISKLKSEGLWFEY